MKYFVLATICIYFLVQPIAGWEPEDEICSKKLNIEKSVLETLIDKLLHDIDNEVYNKYSECYWREKKMLNEDGTIDWAAVKKELGSAVIAVDEFNAIVDKCKEKNISGKDIGQTVVKNQNCMVKEFLKD